MSAETLTEKLARLEKELERFLVLRRKYWLMSCACYELADIGADVKDLQRVLSKDDTKLLDQGLDNYAIASAMVMELRTQISDVRRGLGLAEKFGVKL